MAAFAFWIPDQVRDDEEPMSELGWKAAAPNIRHSRESGNPVWDQPTPTLGPRFRGDDEVEGMCRLVLIVPRYYPLPFVSSEVETPIEMAPSRGASRLRSMQTGLDGQQLVVCCLLLPSSESQPHKQKPARIAPRRPSDRISGKCGVRRRGAPHCLRRRCRAAHSRAPRRSRYNFRLRTPAPVSCAACR